MKQTTLKRKQQRTEAIKNKVCIYQGFTSKSWQQKMENYSCLDLRYIDGRVGVAIGNLFSSFSIGSVKGTRFFLLIDFSKIDDHCCSCSSCRSVSW